MEPARGSQDDWFSPARAESSSRQAPDTTESRVPSTMDRLPSAVRSHRNSAGKKPAKTTTKSGFADLTDTEIGHKELGMTVDAMEAEVRNLNKQNEDLDDEIFRMHIALLKLGDVSEAPFKRTQLIKSIWVVEGHEDVDEPGIEFECKAEHGVQILNCHGGSSPTPITITGCAKRVEIENCKHIRLVVSAVLFEITLTNCSDVLLVVGGELPAVEVDSCTAIAFLICHKMVDGRIRCTNSGGVMVSTVSRTDNPVMLPEHILSAEHLLSAEVPAYFVTTSSYRTWTTQVTAHPAIE